MVEPGAEGPTRREVLHGFAVLSAGVLVGGATTWAEAAEPTLGLRDFAAMSLALCGFPASDADVTRAYLSALEKTHGHEALARLAKVVKDNPGDRLDAAITAAGLDSTANAVVTAWYTGAVDGPSGKTVVTYPLALAWQACDFTKAPAMCAGPIGYWAMAPEPIGP
jgi:hypothetical protein